MCSFAQYYLKQHAHQKHVGPALCVSFHSFFHRRSSKKLLYTVGLEARVL